MNETSVSETRPPGPLPMLCPNCGASGLASCYELNDVPAHSCLLMSSSSEATRYPRGQLHLAFCNDCGFLCNSSYDPKLQSYSPDYEETQHCSECFNDFAKRLASRWIQQYNLKGKTILEIGCGKGQFLDLLCELGGNRGIGIDPACRPERLSEEARSRVKLIQDYYSEAYSDLSADAICCRHTLEHIPDTKQFLQSVRNTVGDRVDTLMLFEVPDTTRILREMAFWDIYYEHCSYFTAGSLARLFRACGFDLLELERDYDDQYLTLSARPTEQPADAYLKLENDLDQTRQDVAAFRRDQAAAIRGWKQRVQELARNGRVVAWGGGSKCVAFCTTLELDEEIDYVVDINPYKHGKFLPGTGHEVVGTSRLREHAPDHILVMNPIYCAEIERTLQQLSVSASLVPVC